LGIEIEGKTDNVAGHNTSPVGLAFDNGVGAA